MDCKKVEAAVRQKDRDTADVVLSQWSQSVQADYQFPSAGRRYTSAQGAQNCRKALREEVRLPGVEDWDTRNAMVSLVCHILPLCGPCVAILCERLPRSQQVRKTSRVNEAMEVRKSRKPFSLQFSVFVDTGSGVWFVVLCCLSRSRRLSFSCVLLSRSWRLSFSCSGVVLAALALERFPVRNG